MESQFDNFIRQFYRRHGLERNDQEIHEAAAHFSAYVSIARRIYDRLEAEGRLDELRVLLRAERERQLKRESVADLWILLNWLAEQKIRTMHSVAVKPRNP